MSLRHCVFIVLLVWLSSPVKAQLIDSYTVIGDGTTLSAASSISNSSISCQAAEQLAAQGCGLEAAIMFSELIVQANFLQDTTNLDRACAGLYRTQFLAKVDKQYIEKLQLCRPAFLATLNTGHELEPMFITPPTFLPSQQWLQNATPGTIYKVSVLFDIDEFGNSSNFDFDADDKFLLRYPIIDRLKEARYLPAVKNGKAVKKSKNLVEVVFCLDIGKTCVN